MTQSDRERIRLLRARLHSLVHEHQQAKERVSEYLRRRWLSAGEEMELKTLQRLKLMKKDQAVAVESELARLEQNVAAATSETESP